MTVGIGSPRRMSERVKGARAKWAAEMLGRRTRLDRGAAMIVSTAIAGFVAGALFVEVLDPFGPSSREDCIYELAQRGAHPALVFEICREMFPPKPLDLSSIGRPAEPPKAPDPAEVIP